MSKFKVGDKVVRDDGITGVCEGFDHGYGLVRRDDGQTGFGPNGLWCMTSDSRWSLLEVKPAVAVPDGGPEWLYSEASRLQAAAHTAIDAYNKYIESKPETVFVRIFK